MDRQEKFAAVFLALIVFFGVGLCYTGHNTAEAESGATRSGGTETLTAFDRQPVGHVFRYGLTGADAAQITSAALADTLTAEFDNQAARQTIPVTAFFTNASATVTVYMVGYWRDANGTSGFKVSPDVTFTAPSANHRDPSGNYMAPTYSFDSMGARFLRLYVVTAPSAGSVSFGVGSQ